MTLCLPAGTSTSAEAKPISMHFWTLSPQLTLGSRSTLVVPWSRPSILRFMAMSRLSRSTTDICRALRDHVRYVIFPGAPNRPNHLGRNVRTCQSWMSLSGSPHCVLTCDTVDDCMAGALSQAMNRPNNNVSDMSKDHVERRIAH